MYIKAHIFTRDFVGYMHGVTGVHRRMAAFVCICRVGGFCGTKEKTCSRLTVQMHLQKEGVCVQRVLASEYVKGVGNSILLK